MKNSILSTLLLITLCMIFAGCPDDDPNLNLDKNFTVNNDPNTSKVQALYEDFQKGDFNESAPDHDHRIEVAIGATAEFKNTSEPKEDILATEWFVYPFKGEPMEEPMGKDSLFSYTFSSVGNYEVMMKANGKNLIKIVRVVSDVMDAGDDEDGDGIADADDDCPSEFGTSKTKGCPDDDDDGVANIKDDCPKEKGTAENRGCPVVASKPNNGGNTPPPPPPPPVADSDNDGIADTRDNCPDEAGTVRAKGCPDADDDSIPDAEDKCPNEKGKSAYNGCPPPDADGDGYTDDKDNCPNEKGTVGGCPDDDRDGIANDKDDCPNKKGSSQYKGCPPPDRDGDGIADEKDNCPDEDGKGSANGCPKPTDSDNDGIADTNDDCPNEAGTLRGCPDSDGDGIADKDDDCKNEKGTTANKGCPDSDRDGIADKDDECPNKAGTAALNGCPPAPTPDKVDSDDDGFADKDDKCPNESGTLGGCPDSDGDGVADKDDDCKNEAGPLKGCPDTDGDGIADKDDDCKNEAGKTALKGCPDSDDDGIADKDDKCPNEKGIATNDGCPKKEPVIVPTPTETNTNITTTTTTTTNPNSSTWYPSNGPSLVGVPYSRCASSHDASNWETNTTTITLTPKARTLLHSARVYASTSGKVQLELKGQTESVKTTVSVNRGSTNLSLDDLSIVLEPGSTYYLSITPLKTGGETVQLDNIATCDPSPKSTSQMSVKYDSGKMVLFNLKYEY